MQVIFPQSATASVFPSRLPPQQYLLRTKHRRTDNDFSVRRYSLFDYLGINKGSLATAAHEQSSSSDTSETTSGTAAYEDTISHPRYRCQAKNSLRPANLSFARGYISGYFWLSISASAHLIPSTAAETMPPA